MLDVRLQTGTAFPCASRCGSLGCIVLSWTVTGHGWPQALHVFGDPALAATLDRDIRREAAMLASVQSPHVIGFIGLCYDDTRTQPLYLLTELAECNFKQYLDCRQSLGYPRLPFSELTGYCEQILLGLQSLHRNGIMHRDVKPENVLVLATGHDLRVISLKVGDVGLARWVADGVPVQGPVYFLAPELQDGVGDGDAKADVYSFGVLVAEVVYHHWMMKNAEVPVERTAMLAEVQGFLKKAKPEFGMFLSYCCAPWSLRYSSEHCLTALRIIMREQGHCPIEHEP
jgi:serine/threonine protein kinase